MLQGAIKPIWENRVRERKSFADSSGEVMRENAKMLRGLLMMSLITSTLLVVIGFTIPSFFELRSVYMLFFGLSLTAKILYKYILYKADALPLLYMYFGILCAGFIYLSAFITPEQMRVSIVGILIITPMVIMDKSWRIDIFATTLCITHIKDWSTLKESCIM